MSAVLMLGAMITLYKEAILNIKEGKIEYIVLNSWTLGMSIWQAAMKKKYEQGTICSVFMWEIARILCFG